MDGDGMGIKDGRRREEGEDCLIPGHPTHRQWRRVCIDPYGRLSLWSAVGAVKKY